MQKHSFGRKTRVLKAASTASFATFIAAFSHLFGGAALPHPIFFLAAIIVATSLAMPLVSAKVSITATSVVVLLSQFLYHALFSYFPADLTLPSYGHDHFAAATGFSFDPVMTASTSMTLAHIAGAILTIAFINRAEWLYQLLLKLAAWFRQKLTPKTQAVSYDPVALTVELDFESHSTVCYLGTLSSRGPPVRYVMH